MAAKPLTSEAIALTEKKMDMALDDIIQMNKTNATKAKKHRVPNRSKKFVNNVSQDKSAKMRRFMDNRSTLRQGALAQRRSNFRGNNQFPLVTEAAKKAAVAPIRRPFSGSRAVNMNKQRARTSPMERMVANRGGFSVKQSQQRVKLVTKQRPQTLDSLFANMKMQRTRVLSQQNNAIARRNGGSQRMPPWQRAGFGNSY